MNYQEIIKSLLDKMLGQLGQPFLKNRFIHFASENDFLHSNHTVHKSKIIKQDSVDNFLKTVAEKRSWIHANLTHIDDKNSLITVRVGERVGNPNPSVNVSFDQNHLAKIITDSK